MYWYLFFLMSVSSFSYNFSQSLNYLTSRNVRIVFFCGRRYYTLCTLPPIDMDWISALQIFFLFLFVSLLCIYMHQVFLSLSHFLFLFVSLCIHASSLSLSHTCFLSLKECHSRFSMS